MPNERDDDASTSPSGLPADAQPQAESDPAVPGEPTAPATSQAPATPPPAVLGQKPVPRPGAAARKNIKHHEGSVKETIISMMISLAMALVAKAYVIEAFVIPTGSMAPTLLGKHMLFDSHQTGYEWTVNPWFENNNRVPYPEQQYEGLFPVVTDPMTVSCVDAAEVREHPRTLRLDKGYTPPSTLKRILAGDRILVHKYLYEIFKPTRYDVVVFKDPEDATINFIKRLIGLPNEQIWIADGDIFARSYKVDASGAAQTGPWRIQRKPARVQQSVWRTIYSSEYVPLEPVSPETGRRWFFTPWNGRDWETQDRRTYRTENADQTSLRWDLERWPITDWEPYNDVRRTTSLLLGGQQWQFPESDLRMRAIVTPDKDDLRIVTTIRARGHAFEAEIVNGEPAVVRMRDGSGPWQELARTSHPVHPFKAGVPRKVEFWHVDQSLQIWIDDEKVLEGDYDWDPGIRLYHSTGKDGTTYTKNDQSLGRPASYAEAATKLVEWAFEGSPVTLARVGLDRDLYYQARNFQRFGGEGPPAYGTHPENLVTLASDEYFMLGDNSPASADGRLWENVDSNVAAQIDDKVGVVNQKLLLGKAFFVYFPAPKSLDVAGFHIPIPDFGNMRFIR